MRGRKRTFGCALVVSVALLTSTLGLVEGATGSASAETGGTPPPEAFIVVDAATGAVLSGRNMHEALPPASTAKIMTALVAVERLPPDALISVSQNAANREAMRIGMQPGSRWPFQQAMATMMLVSANDVAYAMAETVGGSIPGFAADLNATARRYGMHDSTFSDPAGLTDSTSYGGGPKVSAYDLAIATRNALTVPAIARWADTRQYDFTDVDGVHHELTNHDKFLPDNGFGYPGANGFKTGYTLAADHTLVATARRDGRQCIAVILGSVDSGYTWAASLLDQCFATQTIPASDTRLPPVAVSPYGTRAAQQHAFKQLVPSAAVRLAASTKSPSAGTGTGTPPTSRAARRASLPFGRPRLAAKKGPGAKKPATKKKAKHGGPISTTSALIVVFLALVVVVALRRRAVKRQRTRRLERRRARAKAMRSGSLPVVDGRYRTGTRVGPPLESQVRVERVDIDIPAEERRQARRSRERG